MAVIYLLTGPIQSQKTTRLEQWCKNRTGVAGLLSPVLNGKRYFRNLQTTEEKPTEAEPLETEVQLVGRYTFSEKTFKWANEILLSAAASPETKFLVIDEIGPLELQGKGLAPALQQIFAHLPENLNLIFVIREQLTEKVLEHFKLNRYQILPFPPEDAGEIR